MTDLDRLLIKTEFPRSNRYDRGWMLENQMGPNSLWLVEWLCETFPLSPGMRVLDLGCGRAMTSIFLAREFGARVWAADLWISPDHNWRRIVEAGVADLVCPLRAEAHALPFSREFFDAVVSVDAYHYFGTDMLYLNYLSSFVRPGGRVGIVVPGLMQPIGGDIPDHLVGAQANGKPFWENECRSFKTAGWWRDLWTHDSNVTDVVVDTQPDGWLHWRDFEVALETAEKNVFPSDAEALEWDGGRYLGFVRAVARRTGAETTNLYDAAIGARAGVDT
ncbi:MAG: SAM-dependent methyltransferase [Candidatus Latescibacterota bacterium]